MTDFLERIVVFVGVLLAATLGCFVILFVMAIVPVAIVLWDMDATLEIAPIVARVLAAISWILAFWFMLSKDGGRDFWLDRE